MNTLIIDITGAREILLMWYAWVHQTILFANKVNKLVYKNLGTIVDQLKSTETSWSSAQSYKPLNCYISTFMHDMIVNLYSHIKLNKMHALYLHKPP